MFMRPNALNLIVFAIIGLGGFGILRIIFVRHDPAGLLAIFSSLALLVLFQRLATTRNTTVRRLVDTPKWPIPLASNACDVFVYFPGRPEGYAGYTDYTAMSVDVNDDLATRPPPEQYALLGFGVGFLDGIYQQLSGLDCSQRLSVHTETARQAEREYLGWLAYLQKSGTDNAGPSTENLHSVLQSVSREICTNGPIMMQFWDKVRNKRTESLDGSRTSADALDGLKSIYEREALQGEKLALSARVSAERR